MNHAVNQDPAMTESLALNRRHFLATGTGMLSGLSSGLTLGLLLPAGAAQAASAATTASVNAWLSIGSDETITLTVGSSDMGQGSFAGLAQILCEDLRVDPGRVKVVQGGPTQATPAPIGTAINTVGSGVIRNNFWKLRDASAAAYTMLLAAAMFRQGEESPANFSADNGVFTHKPTGTLLSYGLLAPAAALLPVPSAEVAAAALVPDSQFKRIGKTFARPDIPAKVDGSLVYGIDVRVPGMLYAVIKHCPSFGGTLASVPAKPAGALAVVPTQVMAGTGRGTEVTGAVNAVAVVGTNTWDAWQSAKALKVTWKLPANAAKLNSTQFVADAPALLVKATAYVAGAANPPGTLYTVEGNAAGADAAIKACTKKLDATYSLPYVSHGCLEVLNCTVDYVAGVKCEVWAPTQSANGALKLVVALTGLPADKVIFHTTALGGGLGRKAEQDFVSQAVQVAMALGKPVKLMWPREEDFTRDVYRPMALVRVQAGLNSGQVAGWHYRNVSPSIMGQRGAVAASTGDSQGYEASQALPYNFGQRVTEWVSHTAPIPVGFWRSVGASINTFAVESTIDDLAAAAGQDPLLFRRNRLTDPRWLAVLEAVAKAAAWGTAGPKGTAKGIAVGTAFNTIVAQVVEVSSGSGANSGPRVTRVWVAVDSYLTVNPGSVEAQIIGGVVHAMNAALYGRQTFANGAAQSRNFSNNRMMTLGEMPTVAVTLLPAPAAIDRKTPIGGIGELAVPTFAPALANAWFKLSAKRVRTLPFFPTAKMSD